MCRDGAGAAGEVSLLAPRHNPSQALPAGKSHQHVHTWTFASAASVLLQGPFVSQHCMG